MLDASIRKSDYAGGAAFSFSKNNFDLIRLIAAAEVAVRHTMVHLAPKHFVYPLEVLFALVPGLWRVGLLVLAMIFFGNMVFSLWHSGIEWQWWAGPSTCTGGGGLSGAVPDFGNLNVVQCDEPALRILWLSLAGWNGVISGVLAAFAIRQGSSSVSQ